MKLEDYLEEHIFSNVNILTVLNEDLYITYLAIIDTKPVIIKLYVDTSDDTNEGEILELFYEYDIIDYNNLIEDIRVNSDFEIFNVETEGLYRILIYDYESGYTMSRNSKLTQTYYLDIKEQLNKIHNLGFVYGGLSKENILIDSKGKAKLIDFGRTYRDPTFISQIKSEKYPPMDYMYDDDIKTIEDEKKYLEIFRNKILKNKYIF